LAALFDAQTADQLHEAEQAAIVESAVSGAETRKSAVRFHRCLPQRGSALSGNASRPVQSCLHSIPLANSRTGDRTASTQHVYLQGRQSVPPDRGVEFSLDAPCHAAMAPAISGCAARRLHRAHVPSPELCPKNIAVPESPKRQTPKLIERNT
jgi:hypothetical protein